VRTTKKSPETKNEYKTRNKGIRASVSKIHDTIDVDTYGDNGA